MEQVKRNINRDCVDAEGSITVEAAFLMPIVIFAIFAIIYLAFYLHDVCRIQGIVDKTLQKAALCVKHEADLKTGKVNYQVIGDRGVFYLILGATDKDVEQIQKYAQQELSQGLFITKATEIEATVGRFSLVLSVDTEIKVPIPWIKQWFQALSHGRITGEASVHNPAETIRRAEVVLETGSEIKGVDKLKEKLESIFSFK